jgi:hypothetical protein
MYEEQTIFTIKFVLISLIISIFTIMNILMIKYHIEFFIRGDNKYNNAITFFIVKHVKNI